MSETTLERFLKDEEKLIEDVVYLTRSVKQMKATLVLKRRELSSKMCRISMKSFEAHGGTFRLQRDANTQLFDKERFKKDYPDLFARYSSHGYREGGVAFYEKKSK